MYITVCICMCIYIYRSFLILSHKKYLHVLFLSVITHNSLPKFLDLFPKSFGDLRRQRTIFERERSRRRNMCTHQDDQPQNKPPCLHCQPHSYIRMVQHMIERCIILRMTRDECVKALDRHASILPLVTLTVWRGLQKENKNFFETYGHFVSRRPFLSGYVRRSPRFARRTQ